MAEAESSLYPRWKTPRPNLLTFLGRAGENGGRLNILFEEEINELLHKNITRIANTTQHITTGK